MPALREVERFTMSAPPPLALLTDALGHMPFRDVLGWCAARGVAGVELGVGGYSPAPHIAREELLASADARRDLLGTVADADLEIVALNATISRSASATVPSKSRRASALASSSSRAMCGAGE